MCIAPIQKNPLHISRQNTHTHENPQIPYEYMNPKFNGLLQINNVYVIKGYKSYEQQAGVIPNYNKCSKLTLTQNKCSKASL